METFLEFMVWFIPIIWFFAILAILADWLEGLFD